MRVEKTVFISYRRVNSSWALAFYHTLTQYGYDVFFDYKGLSSGSFEQGILENIRSRAHFLVILDPSALDRCDEPDDWFRREIEEAIDCSRNIVPLMLENFDFNAHRVNEKLTGKLEILKEYNGLGVSVEYFDATMIKLREQFLEVALDAVLQPASETALAAVIAQQAAANAAPVVAIANLTVEDHLPTPLPDKNSFYIGEGGIEQPKAFENGSMWLGAVAVIAAAAALFLKLPNLRPADTGNSVPSASLESRPTTVEQPLISLDAQLERELGLSSEGRRQVQWTLNAIGYDAGIADGIFGAKTRSSIGNWQKNNGFIASKYLYEDSYRRLITSPELSANETRPDFCKDGTGWWAMEPNPCPFDQGEGGGYDENGYPLPLPAPERQ